MHRASCDICGKPAAIHETVIGAGEARARHRCVGHGGATWLDAVARAESSLRADPASLVEELRAIAEKDPGWGR